MTTLLGGSPWAFIGLTLILAGFAAFMTGQAVAATWRPVRQVVAYCLLLALADRFLNFALFGGELLSIPGYLSAALCLVLIGVAAFRLTRAWKMVNQYPWLYERSGPFSWREKRG